MPGRIGEGELPTVPVLVPEGRLSELPDVENTGGREHTGDTFWPLTPDSIGLDDLGVEIGPINLGVVGSSPLSLLVGVLLWATRRALVEVPIAITTDNEPVGGIFGGHKSAAIPWTRAIRLYIPGLEVWSPLTDEEEDSSTIFPARTGEAIGFDDEGFHDGLGIIALRPNEIAIRAESIVAIRGLLASSAWFLHSLHWSEEK